jgi:bacterioferritin (cytochrome b1)
MWAPRSWQLTDLAGIIREPVSRRGFLAAGGATFAAGSAVLLSACGEDGDGSVGASSDTDTDVAILNDALALELTAVATYARATKLLKGSDGETARAFLTQEQEHADALTKAIKLLGGLATADPVPLDLPANASSREVLLLATDVENVAIAAYIDAIPRLSTGELRATAAEIAAADAEHLAVLAGALGRPQVPDAFVTGDAAAIS